VGRTDYGGLEAPGSTLLPEWDDRIPYNKITGPISASEVLRGSDETDLVVVSAVSDGAPSKGDMQAAWRARSGGGVTPVLLAVQYRDGNQPRIALLGLAEDALPAFNVEVQLAEQLIGDALGATSPGALHAEVRRRLASLAGAGASGLRNEGLLASHVLQQQVSDLAWAPLCARSLPLLAERSEDLLTGLGYSIEPVAGGSILRDVTGGEPASRAGAAVGR